jgi:hypothetical protein
MLPRQLLNADLRRCEIICYGAVADYGATVNGEIEAPGSFMISLKSNKYKGEFYDT